MSKQLKRFLIALICFIAIATAFILEFALLDITAAWAVVLIVITGVVLVISALWALYKLVDISMGCGRKNDNT